MSRDVYHYTRTCDTCQRAKPLAVQPAGDFQSISVQRPFELVSIDRGRPAATYGARNRYVIVCTEYLTRWVIAAAVPAATTEAIMPIPQSNT